jgi:hypothetical protein
MTDLLDLAKRLRELRYVPINETAAALERAHAELAAERSEHTRLKNTVAFMERQYLASHGGSWGECEYQVRAESAERKLEESTRLLREAVTEMMHFAILDRLVNRIRAYLKDKEQTT